MKIRIIVPIIDYLSQPAGYSMETKYLNTVKDKETEIFEKGIEYGFNTVESELMTIINGSQVVMSVVEDIKKGIEYDGVMVDCFDDPGIEALKELLQIPVAGAFESAIEKALQIGEPFGIITTDDAGLLHERKKVQAFGANDLLYDVEKAETRVDEILYLPKTVVSKVTMAINRMIILKPEIKTVIFGCTGMFLIVEDVRKAVKESNLDITIIEPFANCLKTLEERINTSKNTHIDCCVNYELFNSDNFKWFN